MLQVIGLLSEIIFVLSFCICIISLDFLSKSDQKDIKLELTIGVAKLLHLQNVRTHGSEFACRCANFPVKFVFINHKLCVGSSVRIFQGLFCAYATVINEAPGLGLY